MENAQQSEHLSEHPLEHLSEHPSEHLSERLFTGTYFKDNYAERMFREVAAQHSPLTHVKIPVYLCHAPCGTYISGTYRLEDSREGILLKTDVVETLGEDEVELRLFVGYYHEAAHAYLNGGWLPHARAMAKIAMRNREIINKSNHGGVRLISPLERKLSKIWGKIKEQKDAETEFEGFVDDNFERFNALDEALAYTIANRVTKLNKDKIKAVYPNAPYIIETLPHCTELVALTANDDVAKAFGRNVLAKARNERKDPIDLMEQEVNKYKSNLSASFKWFS